MPARRYQPTIAAAGVFSGLGVIMRPNTLRIIFGLLLGVLAAFFIGALPLIGPAESHGAIIGICPPLFPRFAGRDRRSLTRLLPPYSDAPPLPAPALVDRGSASGLLLALHLAANFFFSVCSVRTDRGPRLTAPP